MGDVSLSELALLEFGLPASARTDELWKLAGGGVALRVSSPAGNALLMVSAEEPLQLAFEAALFELLAGSRFQAPRPRRSLGGSWIAKLPSNGSTAPGAAVCYPWPAGETLPPAEADAPRLMELGRLLARLHQLGEAHPVSVAEAADGPALADRLPRGPEADRLAPILRAPPSGLPLSAAHGGLHPARVLWLGDRCSAILPCGCAASLPLLLDLCEALASWALPLAEPLPALHAIVSGYQALRKLSSDEQDALFHCLRHAAARESARRLLCARPAPLAPLEAAEELRPDELLLAP